MNRVSYTTLRHWNAKYIDTKNCIIALGPDYDPHRDVVVLTISYVYGTR